MYTLFHQVTCLMPSGDQYYLAPLILGSICCKPWEDSFRLCGECNIILEDSITNLQGTISAFRQAIQSLSVSVSVSISLHHSLFLTYSLPPFFLPSFPSSLLFILSGQQFCGGYHGQIVCRQTFLLLFLSFFLIAITLFKKGNAKKAMFTLSHGLRYSPAW